MGHRANFVIIENGRATAYRDRWAALGCTFTLMDGPGEARSAARSSEPTTELMDWAFAEAGYLLDFDENRAIAFGHPDLPLDDDFLEADTAAAMNAAMDALNQGPAEFFKHVAAKWRGWTLVWDDRGVDAFAEHLARRSITVIQTQPASHPAKTADPVEFTVPAGR